MTNLNDDIAATFRAAELQRRQQRREALLRNEAKLADEELDIKGQAAHNAAIARIAAQQDQLEREIKLARLGYWQRLWWALWSFRQ